MESARSLAVMIALRNPMTEWKSCLERVPQDMREEVREILLEFRKSIRGGHSIMDG